MKFSWDRLTLLLALLGAVMGCTKENDPAFPAGPGPALTHIEIGVDSACVQAPNVFTPNGDGINDRFSVYARNIASIEIRIRNADGVTIHTSDDPLFHWDGTDATGSGPYTVLVEAISTSGITIGGQSSLTVMDYGAANCLTYVGTPVCGDQIDPRICGVTYPTNEIFCP